MITQIKHRIMGYWQIVLVGIGSCLAVELVKRLAAAGVMRKPKQLPRRVVLIRHGESEGNATTQTKEAYRAHPDHMIPLTARGKQQAIAAGKELKVILDR